MQIHLKLPGEAIALAPTRCSNRLGDLFGFVAGKDGVDAVHMAKCPVAAAARRGSSICIP